MITYVSKKRETFPLDKIIGEKKMYVDIDIDGGNIRVGGKDVNLMEHQLSEAVVETPCAYIGKSPVPRNAIICTPYFINSGGKILHPPLKSFLIERNTDVLPFLLECCITYFSSADSHDKDNVTLVAFVGKLDAISEFIIANYYNTYGYGTLSQYIADDLSIIEPHKYHMKTPDEIYCISQKLKLPALINLFKRTPVPKLEEILGAIYKLIK